MLAELCREYETVLPIVSQACQTTDTRFGTAEAFLAEVERLTGHTAIPSRAASTVSPMRVKSAISEQGFFSGSSCPNGTKNSWRRWSV